MNNKKTVKPRIIHQMADGTIRDSIEGMTIPFTPATYGAYKVIAEFADRASRNQSIKEEN